MRGGVIAVGLVVAAVALAGCGTQTQTQALRGWINNANFASNSVTLRLDVTHAETALEDATAPATELHTVCGILTTDAEAANSSLPTPNDVGTTELSSAYTEMGTAANTCYYASGRPSSHRTGLAQLAQAAQDLTLATWQVRVGAGLTTDAAATTAWVTETSFDGFVTRTDRSIAAALTDLSSRATPSADAEYCRAHDFVGTSAVRLLPAPDAQASSQIQAALNTLALAVGTCSSITTRTTGPTRPVIASAIANLRRGAQQLFFASERVGIAMQP